MKKTIYILIIPVLFIACNSQENVTTKEEEKAQLATQIVASITAESFQVSPIITISPTETQIPPTETPETEPIFLSGSGDSVVNIELAFKPAIAHITGNQNGRHFAVVNYDAKGDYLDLLVNTSDIYDGFRPLDFDKDEYTTRFEITSSGEWNIEVLPISTAKIAQVPGIIEGIGDDVIMLVGEVPDLAIIKGNSKSRHFAVISYRLDGHYLDLNVNTSDPYEGTVMLDSDAKILEIKSTGNWTIEITSR